MEDIMAESIYKVIPSLILAILAVVLPITLIFFADSKKQRYLTITFLAFGCFLNAGTFYKFKGFPELLAYDVNNGDRYFYPYYVIIMWVLTIGLTSAKAYKRQISTLFILLIVVASVQYFRAPKYTDYHWKEYSDKIESGIPVRVPINPPGWDIELGYPQKENVDSQELENGE